ncbi:23S rRNA (guanosine(2251)-2'-O)-methyltransferase RlmB [Alicyclobacillus sp. ALC3]|uniref:23S rRNA (guanosine(2251)-2'-O)-methyltransferase RlmB n=1 Tax=Alicyclobacillus sp. ALC3 TaxID=2796143 RepID=UPI0030837894
MQRSSRGPTSRAEGPRRSRSSAEGRRARSEGRMQDDGARGGRRGRTVRAPRQLESRSAATASRAKPASVRTEEVSEAPEFVAGRRPVLEVLRAGRAINKLLIAEGAEGGSLAEIVGKAKAAGVLMQKVPRPHLSTIAGEGHQGVVAYVAAHEYADLTDVMSRQTGQPPLVVLLDEVSDPHNLGAVLRTAEGAGAQGVVIPKRRAVPLTGTVAKAAAGALEYLPVARVANLNQAIDQLKKAGYWVVGSTAESGTPYTEVDYKGKIALVVGSEGQGISRLVRERCDYLVNLPMHGKVQSLNASVAAGVLMYEIVRQRG